MKTRLIVILGIMVAGLTALAQLAIQPGHIGIFVSRRSEAEPLKITDVLPGSPAERAGVKTNWFIISIDGTNVVGEFSALCMSMLHGAVGTSVTVELADPNLSRTNKFTMRRADVAWPHDLFLRVFGTNAPSRFATNAPKSLLVVH